MASTKDNPKNIIVVDKSLEKYNKTDFPTLNDKTNKRIDNILLEINPPFE